MAVTKKKDGDWKYYLRELALSGCKISDIEKAEFAGYLLRKDMDNGECLLTENFFLPCEGIMDIVASCLIAESPEAIEDVIRALKNRAIEYYEYEIDERIKDEETLIEEEKKIAKQNEKPEDEHNPYDYID